MTTKARRGREWSATIAVFLLLCLVSASAAWWFYRRGYLLYYGDAQAHLTVARRMIDSRNPGYAQIGTVWLPLPHALMLPFVGNELFWKTGLAGTFPSAACFVLAGTFLFALTRRTFASTAAGLTAVLLFAGNPNALYLQSIPMTEAVFFAGLLGLLASTVWWTRTRTGWAIVLAGIASAAASLTRYEGWFLIPFVCGYLWLTGGSRRWRHAILFGALASLGPLYWLGHNWLYFGDALEFYRGPYSAKAIYQRALDANMARYGGDHDWVKAWLYFRTAVRLCLGRQLVWLGLLGTVAASAKRVYWPVFFLALSPLFYVWSVHSAGVPIFVPELWPGSWYNTRYALGALPLFAFTAAALVAWIPVKWRGWAALAVVSLAFTPWIWRPNPESWICWKESQVNSKARRAWTREAADFLGPRYRPGEGIYTCLGDAVGIYREAGIPLKETLNEGINPWWMASLVRPDLFLHEEWVVTFPDCANHQAMQRAQRRGPAYQYVKIITVPDAPPIEIYRRGNDNPLYEGPRGEE